MKLVKMMIYKFFPSYINSSETKSDALIKHFINFTSDWKLLEFYLNCTYTFSQVRFQCTHYLDFQLRNFWQWLWRPQKHL